MNQLVVAGALLVSLQAQAPAPPPLRIVVLEGEDAVNVVQQQTAVRPLVEVRDRNNLPVTGATVTFTIGGGQPAAFAGGVQTLTVTTNAAGQAAASGFSALGPGAVQIQVQAAYQGQIATAAISQTNFATAAAAAQAGTATGAGTGGSTTGAAGGAAGGGGGLSGTTLGIVGAAAAGGAIAAATRAGGGDGNAEAGNPGQTTVSGPFAGQLVVTTVTRSATQSSQCQSTRAISGTLTVTLEPGGARGSAQATGRIDETALSGSLCSPWPGSSISFNTAVSGGPANLELTFESSFTAPTPGGGGSVTARERYAFKGELANGVVTGSLAYSHTTDGTNVFGGVSTTITGSGSTTLTVTLR